MPSNLTSVEGLWTSAGGRSSKPKKSRGNVAKERLSNVPGSEDASSVAGKSAAIGIPGGPGAGTSSSPSPTIQSHNSLDSGHGSLSETAPISPPPQSASAAAKKGFFARVKKVSLTTGPNTALDPFQFEGDGLLFKGKLIGIKDVEAARGDDMCQAAMVELNKALKASKEHKPRVTVAVAMSGLKIKDEKDAALVLHHHSVPKISYIWRDHSDLRSFGYVCGTPDVGHKFYALKADKSADALVGAIHRLFQLAFKMKQMEIDQVHKAQTLTTGSDTDSGNFFDEAAKKGTTENGQSSPNDSQANEANLLNLESELQVLSQGIAQIKTMQSSVPSAGSGDWADFGSEAAAVVSVPAEVDMSSASSTSSSQPDPWGRGGTPQSQRTITPDPFDTVGATAASLASHGGLFTLQPPPVMPRSVPQPPVPLAAADPFGFAPVTHAVPVSSGNPFADPVDPFVPNAHSDLASIPLAPVEQYVSVFDQPASRPAPLAAENRVFVDPFATSGAFNDICPPLNPTRPPERKISKDDFPRPIKPRLSDLRGEKPVLMPSTSTVDPFLINATRMAVSSDVPARPAPSVDVPQRKVGVVTAPSVPARPLPHPQSAPLLGEAAFAPPVPRRLSPGAQQVPTFNPFIQPADDPFADSFFR